jgi:hypothetical protein
MRIDKRIAVNALSNRSLPPFARYSKAMAGASDPGRK